MKEEKILKELFEIVRNHEPTDEERKMFHSGMDELNFITGRVSVVNKIVEFAKKYGVELLSTPVKP